VRVPCFPTWRSVIAGTAQYLTLAVIISIIIRIAVAFKNRCRYTRTRLCSSLETNMSGAALFARRDFEPTA